MRKIDTFNRAKKAKNNEFYTKYEDVEFFVENSLIKEYLKDKVVYLPCDTEESNIYKYLVNNKERLGIKEILHTSDDYYSHQDLYDKCDVVFTNPPFTGIGKWLPWLDDQNIKYISWFPVMGLYGWHPGRKTKDALEKTIFIGQCGGGTAATNIAFTITGVNSINKKKKCIFDSPNGEKTVAFYIISNDHYFDNFEYVGKAFSKTFEEVKDKLFKLDDGYEVYKSSDVPNNYYDGYLYIPVTAYIGKLNYLEYVDADDITGKDGKSRPRIKVKLKKDEINKIKQRS